MLVPYMPTRKAQHVSQHTFPTCTAGTRYGVLRFPVMGRVHMIVSTTLLPLYLLHLNITQSYLAGEGGAVLPSRPELDHFGRTGAMLAAGRE